MFYRRVRPRPPLASFVSCLWYSEGLEGTHERERLLPNGESGIVFDLREDGRRSNGDRSPIRICDAEGDGGFKSFAPAVFSGARTDSFLLDTSEQERVIGIQFLPGGAFPFLAMPACEVAHATFSLDDIWPGEALLLREELMSAKDVGLMFAILERALLARLNHAAAFDPAIAFAVASLGGFGSPVRVAAVADQVGMSARRFIETFRERTGLTPKAFQRVRRFQRALKTLHAKANWAGLAADCGYYDQPHFIHDFRLFSGMTPGEYMAVATPHLNHIPLK